jgi:hypothetical protein
MQMIASAIAFFFGQPDDIDWFSSNAVGAEDENASDKIKKHSRWKIDQCGVKTRFIEALEYAFIRGEAAVKVTHQERAQIFKRTATILVEVERQRDPDSGRERGLHLPGRFVYRPDAGSAGRACAGTPE